MPNDPGGTLDVLDEVINYEVRRSNDATRPRIDVDIHGVRVVLPAESDANPQTIVEDNARWVLRRWRQYESYREQAPTRCFEAGEPFPFRGDERPLAIRDVDRSRVESDAFVLAIDAVERRGIRGALEALYREEARSLFEARIDHYADAMGVDPGTLELRNQRTRWASCSPTRTLSFNWRLVMAPGEVVDYVVVHELAHLVERNHTDRFWRIVERHDPEYCQHAEWLEENSARLIFTEDDL